MTVTGALFRGARLSATGRAIRRGRIAERLLNILIGRTTGRVLGRVWR